MANRPRDLPISAENASARAVPRRSFLLGGGLVILAFGCGGGTSNEGDTGAGTGTPSGPDGGLEGGPNAAPAWTTIPAQAWVVGVPVSFDLLEYCTDPDADTLMFSLVGTLPAGLSLVGSVITGTASGSCMRAI